LIFFKYLHGYLPNITSNEGKQMYRLILLIIVVALAPISSKAEEPQAWVNKNLDGLVEIYQHFHANPELSFQEEKTAARLSEEWEAVGADVTTGIGGYGVVALLRNGEGPVLMLRTDMDALQVTEKTGLKFASKVKTIGASGNEVGVMHACGHDVHMTNLVGVARYLAANKERWRGTVMMVGQPAEEQDAGAQAMLKEGLFKRFPKPDFAIALHVVPTLASGQVAYRTGYVLANIDSVDIQIHGKGGHGAYPHTTIDPIVQAAQLILALQTIVSREVKPIEPAVITVGSIHHCGTTHNIIGNECHLKLTVRTYSDKVRQQLLDAIKRKAKAVAFSAAAPEPTIEISVGTPSLYNNEGLVVRIVPVFERLLGKEKVVVSEPEMAGEDFSYYGKAGVPVFMYQIGAVDGKRLEHYKQLSQMPPPLHSPMFYSDIEETLRTGVSTMASVALELLKAE
jgi:amidohydrolase